MMAKDIYLAHRDSNKNRRSIFESATCGCFYCLQVFQPKEIAKWCDDNQTALCPHCGIDSVIGDASGYPVGPDLLTGMQKRWFKKNRYRTNPALS